MGTSLTGNNISQSYLGLLKTTDSQAITSSEKRLTDGAGNDTQLYLSTSSLGIGVSNPSLLLEVSGDIEVAGSITVGKGGGSISTNTVLGQNTINNSNNAGSGNVALGYHAMFANTSGNSNVAIGLTALDSNTTGSDNVVIGADAMETSSTGSYNVAIGHEALKDLNSGGHNIAIGNDAGNGITTGSQSIIIGSQADASDVTSQNEIVIGYNLSGNGSNTVTIGNSSITTNYFNGNILLGNSSKLIFGTSDVYISGTTVSDNIQLGVGGSTQFTFAQTTGLRLHQYGSGSITGTVTQRLGVTSTGQVVEIPIGAGALDGSGTAGKLAKFTDSDTLGDSILSETTDLITVQGGVLTRDTIQIFETGQSSVKTYSATAGLQLHSRQSDSGSPYTKTSDIVANADGTVPSVLRLFSKANGDSTPSERIRLDSLGQLGVGTSSPNHLLDVESTGASMRLYNTTSNANTEFYITTAGTTGASKILFGDTADADIGKIIYRHNGNSMAFETNDSEAVRIMSDGDVGIGSNSPGVRLQISKGAIHQQLRVHRDVNGDSTTMGSILLAGDDSDGNVTDYARIHGLSESDNAGSEDGALVFSTLLNSTFNERARISSNGRIGISTSTPVSLLDLSNGNSQGDGIGFGSNLSEIRRGNSGANLQMSHFGNISMIIDSDNNDSSRFFNVMHGNNDSSSATEVFRVQEDGLVGINYATPSAKLHIETGADQGIRIHRTSTNANFGAIEFRNSDDSATNGQIGFNTDQIRIHGTDEILFVNDGNETARFNSSHYLGIGTTSPSSLLHVFADSSSSNEILFENDGTGDAGLTLRSDDNGNGNTFSFIHFDGNDASGNNTRYASIFGQIEDNTAGAEDGQLLLTTLVNNAEVNQLKLNSSGATFAGNVTTTGSSITIDPPSGDAILNLTHSSQSLRIDQNSIRTTTSTNLAFLTNNSTAITIDTSQRVGIGTTVPSSDLHILGVSNDTVSQANANLNVEGSGGNGLVIGTIASAPYSTYIQSGFVDNFSTAVYPIALNPLGGNVTVNQASADAPLQVRQTRDTNGNIRTNGTYAFIAEGNDEGAVGEGIGIHLTGKRTNGSAVRGVSLLSLIQNTGNAHDLVFATSDSGSAPAERGRLTDTGDLMIGKSSIGVPSTGVELRKVGTVVATRDAGTPAIFNREGTTKGNIVDIRQDNVAVMTLGTTGDNTFVQGTANSQDLLLRTNSTNRIRIHDYGATSFDTYGAVQTTPTARLHQHQIFTMSCTAAASGTAKAMVNVGNTNAFDYTIIARIDSNDIGVITGSTATANGTNSGFFSRTAYSGDVSAITPTYNASSDTLDVAVTYSGSVTVTVNITINGVSEVELTRTGGCST